MVLNKIERIRKLIITALFSDDELMELLVLKGGNAVDLIHGAAIRSSIDLDFSLEGDFPETNVSKLQLRFQHLLDTTMRQEGYKVFDLKLFCKPATISPDMEAFWGG